MRSRTTSIMTSMKRTSEMTTRKSRAGVKISWTSRASVRTISPKRARPIPSTRRSCTGSRKRRAVRCTIVWGTSIIGSYLARFCHGRSERVSQNLFRIVDEDEPELTPKLLRHVLDVPLVPAREDHLAAAHAVGGQHLLFDSAHGEH